MSGLYIEARLQAIKDIASASCSDIKDADNIASFCDEIYSAIPKLDKIIEELMNHKDITDLTTVDEEMVEGFTIYQGAFNEAIDDAIEIVKQGGVSDASDNACEWKRYPSNWFVGCDGCKVKHKQGDYCPICGKKILCKE